MRSVFVSLTQCERHVRGVVLVAFDMSHANLHLLSSVDGAMLVCSMT